MALELTFPSFFIVNDENRIKVLDIFMGLNNFDLHTRILKNIKWLMIYYDFRQNLKLKRLHKKKKKHMTMDLQYFYIITSTTCDNLKYATVKQNRTHSKKYTGIFLISYV